MTKGATVRVVTPAIYQRIADIARHCARGSFWTRTPGVKHPSHVKSPLMRDHLEPHLRGGPRVGLSPIAPGESTTRLALLDMDSHKGDVSWSDMCDAHAQNVMAALREVGLAPIPFRSSGGHGIHLLMMWDEPQDAYSVRELLNGCIAKAGYMPGTKGIGNGQIEVFPKQDAVATDGWGSMFVLPGGGESAPMDADTLGVLPWEAIAHVQLVASAPVPQRKRPTAERKAPTVAAGDHAVLRSALAAITNENEGLDYDAWRNVVFGIHYATGGDESGRALAHEFSSRSAKYDPAFLDERVWPYVKTTRQGTLITQDTIFDMARKHGWVEPIELHFEDLTASTGQAAESAPPSVAPESAHARDLPPGAGAGRFQVVPDTEFRKRPAPDWIIKGVLPRAELVLIIGKTGSGKSFLSLDLAAAAARGLPWRGRKVKKPARVAYVIAEGAGAFGQRMDAYAAHHGLQEIGIGVIADTPNLMQKEDVKAVIASLKAYGKVDVVIVDTFAQATAGADENAGQDMSRALGHCKEIHRHTGAVVALVHHVGKDESKGARGWSGLKAAADAEIEVRRNDEARVAAITKMKDGLEGEEFPFRLAVVSLGRDEDGDAIDSCVVEHLEQVANSRPAPKGKWQTALWRKLHDLVDIGDTRVGVEELFANVTNDVDQSMRHPRIRTMLRQALDSLKDGGYVRITDGHVVIAA